MNWEAERKELFDLGISDFPDHGIWRVTVNGLEVKDYTLEKSAIRLANLPIDAKIAVTFQAK